MAWVHVQPCDTPKQKQQQQLLQRSGGFLTTTNDGWTMHDEYGIHSTHHPCPWVTRWTGTVPHGYRTSEGLCRSLSAKGMRNEPWKGTRIRMWDETWRGEEGVGGGGIGGKQQAKEGDGAGNALVKKGCRWGWVCCASGIDSLLCSALFCSQFLRPVPARVICLPACAVPHYGTRCLHCFHSEFWYFAYACWGCILDLRGLSVALANVGFVR